MLDQSLKTQVNPVLVIDIFKVLAISKEDILTKKDHKEILTKKDHKYHYYIFFHASFLKYSSPT